MFAGLLGSGGMAQVSVLLDGGAALTSGAHFPTISEHKDASLSVHWGHGFHGGFTFLLGPEEAKRFTGLRLITRSYRHSIAYETATSNSPSSFYQEKYQYEGVIHANGHALSIPFQLWLRLGPRSRLTLGADLRIVVLRTLSERGELTTTRYQYALPDYHLESETTTVSDYEKNLGGSGSRADLSVGLGCRHRIGQEIFIGPDLGLVIPVAVQSSGGPVLEASLSLSWLLWPMPVDAGSGIP